MLKLVAQHADWWNLPATHVNELPQLVDKIGSARASVQQMVGFVGDGADAEAVIGKARRRFSQLGPGLVCGGADELVAYFTGLRDHGAQRFYVWFSDFAAPETIAEFGKRVVAALRE